MTTSSNKILIVDDDQDVRISLFEVLSHGRFQVMAAENVTMALEMVADNQPDLVLADLIMPDGTGLDLLKKLKVMFPDLPVILVTGHASVDTAVEAMRLGAQDYILKPFQRDAVLETVDMALHSQRLTPVTSVLAAARRKRGGSQDKPIVGNSENLRKIMIRAKSVASSKATVLILGASGTGKEVFARYIHNESDRRNGPFVALNCAALPEGLLESELFGHEKGAFTGAVVAKKGKFELANGGTLLLDEIAEVPLHMQAKLLRVLQEEEVDRVGGSAPVKVDVHVVATTNRDLAEMVKEGTFRQDLFYRLNVIPLKLPSLAQRPGDIPLLAQYFLEKFSSQYNKELKRFSGPVRRYFLEYEWPGNVREMENLVERGVLLNDHREYILEDFFDEVVSESVVEAPVPQWQVSEPACRQDDTQVMQPFTDNDDVVPLKDVERQMIMHALQKTDNNRTHAAKMLGISVRTLRNKLHEYRTLGILR
ncbi:MAG: sigma-54 dependent transcriptional regulator [Proteobacteria bacterium]|nr:sigma-54 dependent transcriptional regulator [Pseudomonadota bacterium]MBU1639959.1 sigma-54 dependent transcriptional regulator [Pseudomonadota bacterium]